MLRITIPGTECWDDILEVFISTKDQTLCLEHSLVSLSKWESKWKKPYLSTVEHTREEVLDYARCMTITQNVPEDVYYAMTDQNIKAIEKYIADPMTATTFSKDKTRKNKRNKEIITSELIYYWMVMYQIPFSCEKWHLNRLMTLINICSIKNEPQKKRARSEILQQNAALNAQRKKMLNTRG